MISLEQIPQLVVHYGCRIPLKTELKPTERESLKALLQEDDPEHFQIFQSDAQGMPGMGLGMAGQSPGLFTVFRQYPIEGGAIATAPTLFILPDSITIPVLIKAGQKFYTPSHDIKAQELDKKMRTVLFKIADVIKGLKYTRAGKVYELVVPISLDKKEAFLKKILADPNTDIAELGLVLTKLQTVEGKILNINTQLKFAQMKLEDQLVVNIKVDINNRDLQNSMEQRDVDFVWKSANNLIESHLENLLV